MRQEIPFPELQHAYMARTGTQISMAEVQWLCHYKRKGMSDDMAIESTLVVFHLHPTLA